MAASAIPPGIRFEFVDPPRPSREIRTDIAGFVGFAERGPLDAPVRLESWHQYEATFGGFSTPAYLPYAARLFFENGGQTLYVVRVAVRPDDISVPRESRAQNAFAFLRLASRKSLRVEARTPGRWGNRLRIEVTAEGTERSTVRVWEGDRVWRLADVSLKPTDERFLGRLVAPPLTGATFEPLGEGRLAGSLGPPIALHWPPIEDDGNAGDPPDKSVADSLSPGEVRLRGGRDGIAACSPQRLMGGTDAQGNRLGLTALEVVDPVNMVAMPDAVAFPVSEVKYRPVRRAPCTELEPPALPGSLYRSPDAMPVATLAVLLGVKERELRGANPDLGETVAGGQVVSVPLPPGVASDDPTIDPPADGSPTPDEVRDWLEKTAKRFGLTLAELLRANPAYRGVISPQVPWQFPQIPIRIPEPPFETPPQWTREQTKKLSERLIQFCELRGDCVALLDVPRGDINPEQAIHYRESLTRRTSFAALYWPWLETPSATGDATALIRVPPSGAVAGLTANTDVTYGPHRTPAGNPLRGVVATAFKSSEADHGRLNRLGVNVLRERAARGVVLEGARTLYRNGLLRYFNIRRTILAIREAIEERTQWAVFESSGPRLWADLRDQIRALLTGLWRRGWLSGTTAAAAFYVKCDEATNPPSERELGRVIALIGMRIPPPMEWIVVRIGRSSSGVEILDIGSP